MHAQNSLTAWRGPDFDVQSLEEAADPMPFKFSLYRAPAGLGSLWNWDCEQREPLGTRAEVKAALDAVLPGLRWQAANDLLWASGPFADDEHAIELSLFGPPEEPLMDISVYAAPPGLRAIMSGLRLNYCCAKESGELRDPFNAGDRWPDHDR